MKNNSLAFKISLADLVEVVGGTASSRVNLQLEISSISIDSRSLKKGAAFVALLGKRSNGNNYAVSALSNGAVVAIVTKEWYIRHGNADLPVIQVDDTLEALQVISGWWRNKCSGSVIAITGSNGKTTVKECLFRLLSSNYSVYQSPGSFNSQVGVPLSLTRMPSGADYNIIEIGVSRQGEMQRLESLVRPNMGILTNIGWAHISSFGNQHAIAEEKARLFEHITADGWLLMPDDVTEASTITSIAPCVVHRYGQFSELLPRPLRRVASNTSTIIQYEFPGGTRVDISVGSPSLHIVKDVEIAICAAYLLGVSAQQIIECLADYAPIPTRMEIWRSPSGITLINDSYDSDLLSVQAALNTMEALARTSGRRFFVFGGMTDTGEHEGDFYARVGQLAAENAVDYLVVIGNGPIEITVSAYVDACGPNNSRNVVKVGALDGVKDAIMPLAKWGDYVLVKGPHAADIDSVSKDLIGAMAPNRFIVDLGAIQENINRFRRLVGPSTAILAMVKALAYGSDAARLSAAMESFGVDAFGVSSVDEGRSLRLAGINSEVLVMLCTPGEVENLVRDNLTPVIYSFEILSLIANAAKRHGKRLNVHIEVDTGMGRTGVFPEQTLELADAISSSGVLCLTGVMTHFASADDASEDEFTKAQITKFDRVLDLLKQQGYTDLVRHAAATSAAIRFPESRYDMVRVGLGLYGIYPSPSVEACLDMVLAVALVSRISRVQHYRIGDRIGYGGTHTVERDGFRTGVVPIGYHDGVPRNLSNIGFALVGGHKARIVGRVSMDSMLLDLTDIPIAAEGTEVLIYGSYGGYELRPETAALAAETIPYELLVRLGPRVQRVYIGA